MGRFSGRHDGGDADLLQKQKKSALHGTLRDLLQVPGTAPRAMFTRSFV